MPKVEVISGDRYSRLTILKELDRYVFKSGRQVRQFLCKCDCGNEVVVSLSHLRSGHTRSCGCLNKEVTYLRSRKYNTYETDGEVTKVFDNKGNFTLIDTEDLEKVKPYYFTKIAKDYFASDLKSGYIHLHRLITDCPEGMVVDHINHDKADNRKCNLRICTIRQNNMNKKVKGYSYNKSSGNWRSYLMLNGKTVWYGIHHTEDEAKKARKKAEELYFGEYACR